MQKNIIIAFIAGILITVFCFHTYLVYQLRSQTIANSGDIKAIVEFINKNTQANPSTPAK